MSSSLISNILLLLVTLLRDLSATYIKTKSVSSFARGVSTPYVTSVWTSIKHQERNPVLTLITLLLILRSTRRRFTNHIWVPICKWRKKGTKRRLCLRRGIIWWRKLVRNYLWSYTSSSLTIWYTHKSKY
jgi:hypothetical protein